MKIYSCNAFIIINVLLSTSITKIKKYILQQLLQDYKLYKINKTMDDVIGMDIDDTSTGK